MLSWPVVSFGQSFWNLNFEAANVQGYHPGDSIPASLALPGWTVTSSNTWIAYDALSLGGPVVSICDTNVYSGFQPLQGRFSAYLFGGYVPGYPGGGATISQTGLVPANALSLDLWVGTGYTPFNVTLGGSSIDMLPWYQSGNYTVFHGDISAVAGEVATLSITSLLPYGTPPGRLLLDNISFSPIAIPEPASLALLGLTCWLVQRRHSKP